MTEDDAIERFWADAKVRANLNRLRAYTGPNASESLRPPAWAFGDSPELADELVGLVLDGRKTATAGALADYQAEDEQLPTVGSLSIVTDGAGNPRVLIQTTGVETLPFGEVDGEHARLEGEGNLSLDHWREAHRTFFAGFGHEVTDEFPVVLERFEVLWQP
ncbi:MAG TPA: ASCH domain-containing protein [Nocardioides sp.]